MWNDLEVGWQAAFGSAWNAFKEKTIPIGAAIVNEQDVLVSTGQNKIYSKQGNPKEIYQHHLAHAEINAILKLNEEEHPNIRQYTLYAVMEPCPLCFGAIVMGSIRHVKYAARDTWAGATILNSRSEYIQSKKIKVEGPFADLEKIQIALQTYFEYERFRTDIVVKRWETHCETGVKLGRNLFAAGTLRKFANDNCTAGHVMDYMFERIDKK
ncbi:MAG: nucleoside deaminase [Herbinix sp.]|jgi:tRNA(Arg) A34 adenosine deaminase TadA|nr:nucleoside deaminase [Herbinix sp.]